MMRRNKQKLLAAGLASTLLALTACDDGLGRLGQFNLVDDTPGVILIAGGRLVTVRFNRFGASLVTTPVSALQVLGPASSLPKPLSAAPRNIGVRPGGEFGGGPTDPFTDPDPDEHIFDPDDWPGDDDDPFPQPPLPTPDIPDEDPFDIPDDSPFDMNFDYTNHSDGSVSNTNLSGGATGQSNAPPRSATSDRAARTSRIRIGAAPVALKHSPDRKRLYVSYAQGVAVLDRATSSVVDQITLPPEARPHSLAVSLDGKKLYITSYLSTAAQLYVVDVTTKAVLATIPVGGYPSGIAITPDGSQVWVTSFFSGNATVVDTLTNTRVLVISNLSSAWGIGFNPTGTRAYITSAESVGGSLRVIDTSRYAEIAKIPTGNGSRALGVTPSGRHVFVANALVDTVSQVDTITNTVVRTIKVGTRPTGFQFMR